MDRINVAHSHCRRNRIELLEGKRCGCFYCLAVFSPQEITHWVTETDGQQTALCPKCSIDSVISDLPDFRVSQEFLQEMNRYWFAT